MKQDNHPLSAMGNFRLFAKWSRMNSLEPIEKRFLRALFCWGPIPAGCLPQKKFITSPVPFQQTRPVACGAWDIINNRPVFSANQGDWKSVLFANV